MSAEIKPIADLNRSKLSDVVPLATPFALYLFHTNVCNFKCNYCAHSLGYKGMKRQYDFVPEVMNMDIFYKTLEQLKDFPNKFKFVSFTGQGEPLTNKKLPELVGRMRRANVADTLEVITNGSLLNHEMSMGLLEAGIDRVKISLQGVTSKAFKEIAGVHVAFEQYVENIKFFYENKGKTQLFIKVMKESLAPGDDKKFYDIFGPITDRMYIETCRPVYPGVDYEEMNESESMQTDRFGRPHEKRIVCPLPFFHIVVWPNGDVVPCDTILKPVVLGNVKNEKMIDMWNGEIHREFCAMQLRGERMTANKKCSECIAPDDVAHPEDALDEYAEKILKEHYS